MAEKIESPLMTALFDDDIKRRLGAATDYIFTNENFVRSVSLAINGVLSKVTDREDVFRDLYSIKQTLGQFELSFQYQREALQESPQAEQVPEKQAPQYH